MDLSVALSSLNINNESPLKITNFAALIREVHTEFIIAHFSNKIIYLITQFNKIGNLFSVECEQVENSVINNEPIYNLKPLLGGDTNIELEAGVKFLASKLDIKKPLIISLTLKNYKVQHLKLIIECIKSYKPNQNY